MRWSVSRCAQMRLYTTAAPQDALRLLWLLLFCFAPLIGCALDHSANAAGSDGAVQADSGANEGGPPHEGGGAGSDSATPSADGGAVDSSVLSDAGSAGSTDAGSAPDASLPATLLSLELQPAGASLAKGTSRQLSATGVYSDDTTRDLTGMVTWSSSNLAIATVAATGRAAGVEVGSVTITAQLGSISGTTTLTVTAATLVALNLSPAIATIAAGTGEQLVAIGTFSDATTQDLTAAAIWTSSAEGIATVTGDGRVTGVTAGEATIAATFGGRTGSINVAVTSATLVSLAVSPASGSIAKGTSVAFTAVGTFSDNSTQDLTAQVSWASGAANVATISNASGSQGVAVGVTPGQATISATKGTIVGSTTLTVTSATLSSIVVSPAAQSFPAGTSQPYTALGNYSDGTTQDLTHAVVWASSDAMVLSVSNSSATAGVASGVRAGSATISASWSGVSGSTTATVTQAVLTSLAIAPTSATISRGTTQQFTATGTYSDGTTRDLTTMVAWASSSSTVAAISNAEGSEGLATGLAAGETSISASQGAISASTEVTVTISTLSSIAITPVSPSLAIGTSQAFVAIGTYSDNTTQDLTKSVTWKSSDAAIAAISNAAGSEGLATALAQGQTLISATLGTTLGTTLLTVNPASLVAIEVTPAGITLARGTTQQYRAKGTFSDGSVQDVTALVTWSSSQNGVASIANARNARGVASALAAGQTTISATRGSVVGSTMLTVKDVVSIAVTPATPSIAVGTTLQFAATGTYSDGSTGDLTAQVSWSSTDQTVVIISNLGSSRGLASAVRAGMTTIRASLSPALRGTTTATVP